MSSFLALGGPIAWIIVLLGAVALVVFLERALQLHRDRVDVSDFLRGIFNALERGNDSEAKTLCDETPGPVARLVSVAIRRRSLPRADFLKELDQAGAAEIARMERRLSLLALIAQTAPLLGLLGTAIGILKALLAAGANIPLLLTADVTEGLVLGAATTVAGLIVAIPSHFGFHVLVVKIDRLVLDMRDAGSETVHFIDKLRQSDAAKTGKADGK